MLAHATPCAVALKSPCSSHADEYSVTPAWPAVHDCSVALHAFANVTTTPPQQRGWYDRGSKTESVTGAIVPDGYAAAGLIVDASATHGRPDAVRVRVCTGGGTRDADTDTDTDERVAMPRDSLRVAPVREADAVRLAVTVRVNARERLALALALAALPVTVPDAAGVARESDGVRDADSDGGTDLVAVRLDAAVRDGVVVDVGDSVRVGVVVGRVGELLAVPRVALAHGECDPAVALVRVGLAVRVRESCERICGMSCE